VSVLEALATISMAAIGSLVQGSTGLGMTLISAPALIAIDADFAPGPLMAAGFVVSLRNMLSERQYAEISDLKTLFIGLPFGLAAGIAVLAVVDDATLALFIGITIVVFAVILLAGATFTRSPRIIFACGFLAAFTSSTAALPGPPMAMTFADVSSARLRGTVGTYVSALGLFLFAALFVSGRFGLHELKLAATLAPGVAIGLGLSGRARPHLDRPWFRPAILILSAAGGATLILRNL
jgi:uncharacterized membrane protein YfcA